MSIEFNHIPQSLRKPGVYTEYNNKGAVNSLPNNKQEVLIIAPMTKENAMAFTGAIQIYSDKEAMSYFGAGSWAHLMSKIAIRNNSLLNLSVIGLKDNSAGVAATATVTLNGTATVIGVMGVNIGGTEYKISVNKSEDAATVANRLTAVINAGEESLVSATVSSKTITLTAKSKGQIGNEIALSTYNSVSDMTIAATSFTGGQENADIAPALASVAGTKYDVIISAFSDEKNAVALREHLATVSAPLEKKPGIGVLGWRDSLATGTTFTGKLNAERLTVGWYKGCIQGNALIAAGYGAIIAGEEDPAKPLNTLEIKGLSLVDVSNTPLLTEANQALYNGLTPITMVNQRVQIMRAITTYTKSATNTDDPSYLDLTTIRTLDYVRKAVEQRLELRFPRDKLSQRTPKKVRSEIIDVLVKMEEAEILENVQSHLAKLMVERDNVDVNRLNLAIPTDVVNGLHIIANRIDLIL
ncbi:phage tail sheath subtilisin-like domain-containing protein [Volucribacter amazonae]|uniref:Phage tail protein n=1 Tax=Volucribacter amazonae TaxID=256731 RepID=A0A9X4P9B8_9PAST|nr:phage tail sheath subtilisin-like domain-containing protein [Volucribacter amazonae]MDG6895040.1 phage tail protein [Volucribacter amazonae]